MTPEPDPIGMGEMVLATRRGGRQDDGSGLPPLDEIPPPPHPGPARKTAANGEGERDEDADAPHLPPFRLPGRGAARPDR